MRKRWMQRRSQTYAYTIDYIRWMQPSVCGTFCVPNLKYMKYDWWAFDMWIKMKHTIVKPKPNQNEASSKSIKLKSEWNECVYSPTIFFFIFKHQRKQIRCVHTVELLLMEQEKYNIYETWNTWVGIIIRPTKHKKQCNNKSTVRTRISMEWKNEKLGDRQRQRNEKKKREKNTLYRKYGGHTLRLDTGNHWELRKFFFLFKPSPSIIQPIAYTHKTCIYMYACIMFSFSFNYFSIWYIWLVIWRFDFFYFRSVSLLHFVKLFDFWFCNSYWVDTHCIQ